MDFAGFEIKRKKKDEELPLPSFTAPITDDGAVTVQAGGAYGYVIDLDGSIDNDTDLLMKYREMALVPDVESAIDEIVNEAIVNDPGEDPVKLVLDDIEISDQLKKKIEDEFKYILRLLNFQYEAYEIFRRWYVEGRQFFHLLVDENTPSKGIKEIRRLDTAKTKKVRQISKKRGKKGAPVVTIEDEYFVYAESGFGSQKNFIIEASDVKGVKITKDSMAYITSGLTNSKGDMVLSYLHKAIRPLNQLRNMEDSTVIYRLTRSVERRVFYIDVGTLPPAKADQHIQSVMNKFKNKVVYDPTTGQIKDDRKFQTILEDFWLPRRGDKSTEITTIPGGATLGQGMEEVEYFLKKLYKALNVPISRMDPDYVNSLGRATEISRDEVKFQKFIDRLRMRFQNLFTTILGKHLVLKNICTAEDWMQWQYVIDYKFARDIFFSELKELEIFNERLQVLMLADQYEGKFFSREYIKSKILRQSETEIKEIQGQIDSDKKEYPLEYPELLDAANSLNNNDKQPTRGQK